MQNFQETFETVKRSFISAFSISMTVPLSYLSHAISPYLYGKLINWTSAFYLDVFFMSRVSSIVWIFNYILCFFKCNFTSHGICINSGNQQIDYLVSFYFFVACMEQLNPIVKRYLATLLDFQNYYDPQNNY